MVNCCGCPHFVPHPPHGGRLKTQGFFTGRNLFQPTSPAWGTTQNSPIFIEPFCTRCLFSANHEANIIKQALFSGILYQEIANFQVRISPKKPERCRFAQAKQSRFAVGKVRQPRQPSGMQAACVIPSAGPRGHSLAWRRRAQSGAGTDCQDCKSAGYQRRGQ